MAQGSIWIFITGKFYAWYFEILLVPQWRMAIVIGKSWKEFGNVYKIVTGGYKIFDANVCVFRRSSIILISFDIQWIIFDIYYTFQITTITIVSHYKDKEISRYFI